MTSYALNSNDFKCIKNLRPYILDILYIVCMILALLVVSNIYIRILIIVIASVAMCLWTNYKYKNNVFKRVKYMIYKY